jgi:Concanavalin A-like lectin/glucanases superfamily
MTTRARAALVSAAIAACGAGLMPASAAAHPELAGAWAFDEPDGQVAFDQGPSGLDGRLGSSPEPDAADPARIAGARGGALRFEGRSFVRLPVARELALDTLTVESVVRAPASPGPFRYVVSRGSQGCLAGSYGLYTGAAGGMAFYVFDGSRYVVSATARPADVWDGAWHHVAGTFDGRELRLYVDGRLVGEQLDRPMRIDYATTTSNMAFGRYVGDCDLALRGDVDMVRIWSGSRSAADLLGAARDALPPGGGAPSKPGAAAPPAILPGPPGNAPRKTAPGAPARACNLRLSRTRIPARRRTVVHARVTVRGRPVRAVAVLAKRRGRSKPITAARTGAHGRARLVLRVRRTGRLRITAATTPRCVPRFVKVGRTR